MKRMLLFVRIRLNHVLVKIVMIQNVELFARVSKHLVKNIAGRFGIINSPVVMFQINFEPLGQRIERKAFHVRIQNSCQRQRIDPRFFNLRHAMAKIAGIHEVDVKRGIVSDDDASLAKFTKEFENFFFRF